MKPYLVVLDLDGTTLHDWESLTPYTIETVKKVTSLGHMVCIATGRPYRSSKPFYDQLGLNTPIINYNGALIQHPNDSSFPLYENFIPLEAVHDILEANEAHIKNSFCEYHEEIYLYEEDEAITPFVHPEGGHIILGSFKETLKKDPHGFILMAKKNHSQPIMDDIKQRFKGVLDCRNWGGEAEHIIEVYTPKTCKGLAVEYVAKHYDIPSTQTIAFGDGLNDVEMIRMAHHGVAMENAVAEVKAVSDRVAPHHKEDGVARYLTQFFSLK